MLKFQPLLPADDESLDDRTAALGEWCQGFLYGLGAGRAVPDPDTLKGEAAEVLRDITEITHVDVDPGRRIGIQRSRPMPSWWSSCAWACSCCTNSCSPCANRPPPPGNRCTDEAQDVRAPQAAVCRRSRVPPCRAGNAEFARRRKQLMRIMGRDAIAIVPAAPVRQRNNDVEHPYRQDSDFQYLTGFGEPEAVAVLVPGRAAAEYVLFVRDRDPLRETWDGRRAGPAGAVERYAADDAFPISDMDEILPGLMEDRERVYYAMGTHPEFDQRVLGWLQGLRGTGAAWASIRRRR